MIMLEAERNAYTSNPHMLLFKQHIVDDITFTTIMETLNVMILFVI